MPDELDVLIDEALGVEPPRPPLVEGVSPQVSLLATPGVEGPAGRYPGGDAPDELDALIDEALAPQPSGFNPFGGMMEAAGAGLQKAYNVSQYRPPTPHLLGPPENLPGPVAAVQGGLERIPSQLVGTAAGLWAKNPMPGAPGVLSLAKWLIPEQVKQAQAPILAIAEEAKRQDKAIQAATAESYKKSVVPEFINEAVGTVANFMGQAAIVGPGAILPVLGAETFDETFDEGIAAGFSEAEATAHGAFNALAVVATGGAMKKLGLGQHAFKVTAGIRNQIWGAVKGALSEVPTFQLMDLAIKVERILTDLEKNGEETTMDAILGNLKASLPIPLLAKAAGVSIATLKGEPAFAAELAQAEPTRSSFADLLETFKDPATKLGITGKMNAKERQQFVDWAKQATLPEDQANAARSAKAPEAMLTPEGVIPQPTALEARGEQPVTKGGIPRETLPPGKRIGEWKVSEDGKWLVQDSGRSVRIDSEKGRAILGQEMQNAEGIGRGVEATGGKEGTLGGEEGSVRLRDNAEKRLEAQAGTPELRPAEQSVERRRNPRLRELYQALPTEQREATQVVDNSTGGAGVQTMGAHRLLDGAGDFEGRPYVFADMKGVKQLNALYKESGADKVVGGFSTLWQSVFGHEISFRSHPEGGDEFFARPERGQDAALLDQFKKKMAETTIELDGPNGKVLVKLDALFGTGDTYDDAAGTAKYDAQRAKALAASEVQLAAGGDVSGVHETPGRGRPSREGGQGQPAKVTAPSAPPPEATIRKSRTVETPAIEDFLTPRKGDRVQFQPKDATVRVSKERNTQYGVVRSINESGTAMVAVGNEQWPVPLKRLNRLKGPVAQEVAAATKKAIYEKLSPEERKQVKAQSRDTRRAFQEIVKGDWTGPANAAWAVEVKGQRDALLKKHGFTTDDVGQAKALPKVLEAVLEQGRRPELKTVDYLSAESGALGKGDKFTLAGDKYTVKDVGETVKVEDGVKAEFPLDAIPSDKGTKIERGPREKIDVEALSFGEVKAQAKKLGIKTKGSKSATIKAIRAAEEANKTASKVVDPSPLLKSILAGLEQPKYDNLQRELDHAREAARGASNAEITNMAAWVATNPYHPHVALIRNFLPKSKVVEHEDLLGQKFATLEGAQGKGEQAKMFDTELTPDLARERKLKTQHEEEGGKELFSETLQQQAEKSSKLEAAGSMGGAALLNEPKVWDMQVPEAIRSSNPAVETRLQAAHGIRRQSLSSRVGEVSRAAWHKLTRAQEHIATSGERASANEGFRLLKNVPKAESDEVMRMLAGILTPTVNGETRALTPEHVSVLDRYLVLKNLEESITRGEPLRFGYKSKEAVAADVKKVQAVVDANPALKAAITAQKAVHKEILAALDAEGLLPKNTDREWYYHQQVLSKLQLESWAARGGMTPKGRVWQKGRVKGDKLGKAYDYNTDWMQAEATWMTEARIEIAKAKIFKQFIVQPYDISAKVKDGEIPEGYEKYVVAPKNYWSPDTGTVERVTGELQEHLMERLKLTPDEATAILAEANPKRVLVLPKDIVAQLKSMKVTEDGVVAQALADVQSMWKAWILFKPTSAAKYMARNATGDLDPGIAAAPGILPKSVGVMPELWRYFSNKVALTKDMRTMRDLGVIDSSMTAEDIPSAKDVPILARFARSESSVTQLPAKYFETVKRFNAFREATLRAGGFLYAKEHLANGTLKHYGGADKAIVQALLREQGVDVAAAHWARNLQGDYGNLTVAGQYARKHLVPFYSWLEVNAKRYPKLTVNAFKAGDIKNAGATGFLTAAALTARIGAMYGALWAWNRLVHGDEDDDLPRYAQQNPHLTLGRNDDGSVIYLNNVGALGDFVEWFGINDLVNRYPAIKRGQMSLGELAVEMAKAPLNKIVQAIRPDIKMGAELLSGKSMFPDVTKWRTTNRDEIVSGLFGLTEEYLATKEAIYKEGRSPRPHYIERKLLDVSDPKDTALSAIYDAKERFLRSQGKEIPDFNRGVTPTANMRRAAMINDYGAFVRAKKTFIASGKGRDQFDKFLQHLDPSQTGIKKGLRDDFARFLDANERRQLGIVKETMKTLRPRLERWWRSTP